MYIYIVEEVKNPNYDCYFLVFVMLNTIWGG